MRRIRGPHSAARGLHPPRPGNRKSRPPPRDSSPRRRRPRAGRRRRHEGPRRGRGGPGAALRAGSGRARGRGGGCAALTATEGPAAAPLSPGPGHGGHRPAARPPRTGTSTPEAPCLRRPGARPPKVIRSLLARRRGRAGPGPRRPDPHFAGDAVPATRGEATFARVRVFWCHAEEDVCFDPQADVQRPEEAGRTRAPGSVRSALRLPKPEVARADPVRPVGPPSLQRPRDSGWGDG